MLVTVASFTEPWEAHLFRLRLESEGIPAVVAHEQHVWAMWPYAMALGGAKVQVPPDEAEKAREVERRCRAGDYRAELEVEMGPLDGVQCQIAARRDLRADNLSISSSCCSHHTSALP